MNLKVPINDSKLKSVIEKLLILNSFQESIFRIVLTGGDTIDGLQFNVNKPTFLLLFKNSLS